MTAQNKSDPRPVETDNHACNYLGSLDFMSSQMIDRALVVANEAADQAGEILKKYFGRISKVEEKFQAGLVSEADREAELAIKSVLSKAFPGHHLMGEETGVSGGSDDSSVENPLWMIDPLDGTTNYIHRVPFFCSSLGLELRGQLAVAVIDAPLLGWRYHATAGNGAFLNGKPIRISNRQEFRDGLFATGFSSSDNTLDIQMELVAHVIRNARGIRRLGAAALDLCLVAEGVFDGFWERGLQPWDTAAGVLIAREAGAIATNFKGQDFQPRMKSIVCATPHSHAQLMNVLQRVERD
jgi:myo-inositol-1(or 4)-monophosphatase